MHGPTRVDPHVKVLDSRVAARAKRRGLDALVYAPHFERLPAIRERAERFSDDELAVIPAREVFTGSWRERRHVLAVGLDDPVPDFITLDAAIREFQRQDAPILVPHPTFATVSLDVEEIRQYRRAIDAIETYNPKHLPWHDRRAPGIATEFDLPAFASSYAHLRGTVGEAWTEFRDAEPTERGIVEALREGAPRRVEHRGTLGHRLRRAAEFCHLGWENTWKKFERVVLSGTEPTHPRHPVYDGRFDDASVY